MPIERDGTAQFIDDAWSLRPWSDKAHISLQYIDDLGDLINSDFSYESAHLRNPCIMRRGPARNPIRFSVHFHAAKFQEHEGPAIQASSRLPIQDRAPIL